MIPLKSDAASRTFSLVNTLLILICMAVFYAQTRYRIQTWFVPLDFIHSLLYPSPETLRALCALGVSFFLHASLFHLLSNMWYLWIFGTATAQALGGIGYLGVFTACGVLSMVIQAASTPFSRVPVVGASGAIAGVMGVYCVFFPLSRLVLWIPPIFFIRVPAVVFLVLWFALQYASWAFHSLPGVALWAHMGGFMAGALTGLFLRLRSRRQ